MSVRRSLVLLAVLALATTAVPAVAGGATVVDDLIWAGDELYGTVLTPATFRRAPAHSTDALYNFGMSGLEGQRPVSDAAPGDRDYNGGRWSVKMVFFTALGESIHDANGDGMVDFELTSEEAVLHHQSLGHLEIVDTDIRFECPLIR